MKDDNKLWFTELAVHNAKRSGSSRWLYKSDARKDYFVAAVRHPDGTVSIFFSEAE